VVAARVDSTATTCRRHAPRLQHTHAWQTKAATSGHARAGHYWLPNSSTCCQRRRPQRAITCCLARTPRCLAGHHLDLLAPLNSFTAPYCSKRIARREFERVMPRCNAVEAGAGNVPLKLHTPLRSSVKLTIRQCSQANREPLLTPLETMRCHDRGPRL
jgi:hypothetical protein